MATRREDETDRVRKRYDRWSSFYDRYDAICEAAVYRRWRRRLWSQVPPGRGLEIGVGTGKNIPYYPQGSRVDAVDLSPRMLERARRRTGPKVTLALADADHLPFAAAVFDWAVATFVLCCVPHPVEALRELRRVCKPTARLFFLEHMRSGNRAAGWVMDRLDPLAPPLTSGHINRRTLDNMRMAGLDIRRADDLTPLGIFRLVAAVPG